MAGYIFNSGSGGSGSGDVTGPGSSTDNAIVRFDGVTGKIIQNSVVTVSDVGVTTWPSTFFSGGSLNSSLVVNNSGIPNGAGSIGKLTGILVTSSSNPSLGNVTANMDSLSSVLLQSTTYTSTTNQRTISDAATFIIEGPIVNGGNVNFSNGPYSMYVKAGSSRFDGPILGANGSAAAPEYTFKNSTITGFYLDNGDAAIASQGVFAAKFSVSGGDSVWTFNDALTIQDELSTVVMQADTGGAIQFSNFREFTLTQVPGSSGAPKTFSIFGSAQTNIGASSDIIDVEFGLNRTLTWATGGSNVNYTTLRFFGAEVASAGSTVFGGITGMQFDMPTAGAGVSTDSHVGMFVGGGDIAAGGQGSVTLLVSPLGVKDGIGNISVLANEYISGSSFFGNTSLGNQTATITDLGSLIIDQMIYESDTLTRTVTNCATLMIKGSPTSAGNVIFTNPAMSIWVQGGNSRFDGSIGIGASPNSVTAIDVTSTTKGVRFSRMTTAQRTAITTTNLPGIVVYDTDIDGIFCTNNAGNWVQL